jgi:MerR family transcriptional regulator, light-induced transcriptional regulator
MNKFSIKDVESITGIKSHTLRVWEQRYNFLPTKRTETNIRYYDDDDLRLILNVSILNDNGYKISEIAKMNWDEIARHVATLSKDAGNYNCHVQKLCNHAIGLDEKGLNSVLNKSIKSVGIEETVTQVVYPFLVKLGLMWQTGTINPAQEHFASNIIRQKLFIAIDSIKSIEKENSKKFLLFLPAGEMHEIGLLFAYYLIKSQGHDVLYLGQSLSLKYVQDIASYYQPDFVFSLMTYPVLEEDLDTTINKFKSTFKDIPVLLAGNQLNYLNIDSKENIHFLYEVSQLSRFIHKMEYQADVEM